MINLSSPLKSCWAATMTIYFTESCENHCLHHLLPVVYQLCVTRGWPWPVIRTFSVWIARRLL